MALKIHSTTIQHVDSLCTHTAQWLGCQNPSEWALLPCQNNPSTWQVWHTTITEPLLVSFLLVTVKGHSKICSLITQHSVTGVFHRVYSLWGGKKQKTSCAYIFVQFKSPAEVFVGDRLYCLSYVCAVYVGLLSAIVIKRLERRKWPKRNLPPHSDSVFGLTTHSTWHLPAYMHTGITSPVRSPHIEMILLTES